MNALQVNKSLEKLRQLAWRDRRPGVSIRDVSSAPQNQVNQLDTDLKRDFVALNQELLSILQKFFGDNKVTLAGITRSFFLGLQEHDPETVVDSLGSFQYDLATATSKTENEISTDLKNQLKVARLSFKNHEIRLTVEDKRITIEVLPRKPLTNENLWQSGNQLLAHQSGHGHRKRTPIADTEAYRVTLSVDGTNYSVDIPESVLATARQLEDPAGFLAGNEVLRKVPEKARKRLASAALEKGNPNVMPVASVFTSRHR